MRRLLLFILPWLFLACVSTTRFSSSSRLTPSSEYKSDSIDNDALQQAVNRWLNTPYRYGGQSRQGTDCSGLTRNLYREVYGIELPRTVEEQIKTGRYVQKARLKAGDLVFFRNGGSGVIDHVGIYLGQDKFVHASLQQGVVISELSSSYYQRHYVTARRLLP